MIGSILNYRTFASHPDMGGSLRCPPGHERSWLVPGTGPNGNGISPNMKSQAQWMQWMKTGSCYTCHQIGNKATRELPAALGKFETSAAAWARRIRSGQASGDMFNEGSQFGLPALLKMFGDWTDRIAAGELPPAPPRPQGLERNVVVTLWDWADEKTYLHDQISSDKRNPRVNANGLIYGSPELSSDLMPVLDPARHTDDPGAADPARSDCAAGGRAAGARAVAVLGRRAHLDQQDERAQPDVRWQGPGLDDGHGAPACQPGLL